MYDQRNNQNRSKLITELRNKGMLYKTGTTYIHLVNPFFIRKGELGNVIHQTIQLIQNTPNVTAEHVKNLPWDADTKISGYDYLKTD